MFWIIPLAGILNLLLGIVILLRNSKNPLHYYFFVFVVSTFVSICFDFIFRFFPTLFVLKSAYAFAVLIPLTLFLWILQFCNIPFSRILIWKKLLLFLPTIVLFILCYSDGLVVKKFVSLTILGYRGELGPFFILYSLYYVIYIGIAFFFLFNEYKNSGESTRKIQIGFVTTGILLYSISATTLCLILPNYFSIFDFTLLDAPSLFFFIVPTVYAILKLHLFNVKIIATEFLVFILLLFLFVQITVSNGLQERLLGLVLLVLTAIVGIFLIKSVIKEVSQREKIEKIAKDLENANEHLRELDKQKSEFVSIASHQLRTPLTAIIGYTSMLLEGSYGKLSVSAIETVSKIHQSSRRLAGTIDDFLNISRIEHGKMSYMFSTVEIKDLLINLIDDFSSQVKLKKAELHFTDDGYDTYKVTADANKIRQVFSNLIDNAIKYGKEGQHIDISLTKDFGTHKTRIAVRDNGIGLSQETISALFQKFSRAKDISKVYTEGSGIGLYIAQEMIKAHRGRIWVESAGEGKGATFFVELMSEE
jgi:signal transduction histidine kinase